MSGIPRREVEDSFRLAVSDEWWLPIELLVGVVGYVLWVALTWSLAVDVLQVLGPTADAGAAPGRNVLLAFAVCWLVLPAVAATLRLRARILNFRGNLERRYRFERPAALLAPPVVVLYVALLAWIVLGAFSWQVFLLLVAAVAYLLVRTIAYSYRVFALSRPLLVHVAAFTAFFLQAVAALEVVAGTAAQSAVIEATTAAVGLGGIVGETVTIAGIETPLAAALAVGAPLALIGAFLFAQAVAAFVVRTVEPDVTPADIRGGQRYPPAVRTADGAGPTPQSTVYRSPKSPGPSSGSSGSSGTGTGSASNGRARSSPDTGSAAARSQNGSGSGSGAGASGSSTGSDGAASDEDEQEVEDVSHTRVFTPPDDEQALAGDVPGATDGSGADGGRCPACGQQFSVDTEVRFCPNCGNELA